LTSTRSIGSGRCPTSDRPLLEIGAERSATSQEYLDALAANHRLSRAEGIDFIMDKFKLDALVAPTGGPAWITDLINGDHATEAVRARPPSRAIQHQRYSWISLGTASWHFILWEGLERTTLLKIAYSFEQLTKAGRSHAPANDCNADVLTSRPQARNHRGHKGTRKKLFRFAVKYRARCDSGGWVLTIANLVPDRAAKRALARGGFLWLPQSTTANLRQVRE